MPTSWQYEHGFSGPELVVLQQASIETPEQSVGLELQEARVRFATKLHVH